VNPTRRRGAAWHRAKLLLLGSRCCADPSAAPFWVRLARRIEARRALGLPSFVCPLHHWSTIRTTRGALVPRSRFGERSGKRDDSVLMLRDGNIQVGAGEVQGHPQLG
jgi:hypothetical protein